MANNVVEIVLIGLGPANEAIVNTFHYLSIPAQTSPLGVGEVLTAFESMFQGPFLNCVTSDWKGYISRAKVLDDPDGEFAVEHDISSWVGVASDDSLPLQVCAVVQRSTGSGTRTGRGRIFVSPVAVGTFDVNGIYVPGDTDFAPLATAMKTPLTSGVEGEINPVLYNKTTHAAVDIISAKLSVLAGTRRSRRVRSPN